MNSLFRCQHKSIRKIESETAPTVMGNSKGVKQEQHSTESLILITSYSNDPRQKFTLISLRLLITIMFLFHLLLKLQMT